MAAIEATPANHLGQGEHNHHAAGLRRDSLSSYVAKGLCPNAGFIAGAQLAWKA